MQHELFLQVISMHLKSEWIWKIRMESELAEWVKRYLWKIREIHVLALQLFMSGTDESCCFAEMLTEKYVKEAFLS